MIYSNPTAMGKHIAKLINKFNSTYYNPFYHLPTTMSNNTQLREMKPGDIFDVLYENTKIIVDVFPNSFSYKNSSNLNVLLFRDFETAEAEKWFLAKPFVEGEHIVRYNSNGSLFEIPDNTSPLFWFVKYFTVTYSENKYQVNKTSYKLADSIPQGILVEQRLFDNEEKAQWWADMLNTNIKITKKLQEINFDNPTSFRFYTITHNTEDNNTVCSRVCDELVFQGAFMVSYEAWDWFNSTKDYDQAEKTDFVKWHR